MITERATALPGAHPPKAEHKKGAGLAGLYAPFGGLRRVADFGGNVVRVAITDRAINFHGGVTLTLSGP